MARRRGTIEAAAKIDHPYYLTRETAEAYFARAGFEIVAERLSDDGHRGFVLAPAEPREPDWERAQPGGDGSNRQALAPAGRGLADANAGARPRPRRLEARGAEEPREAGRQEPRPPGARDGARGRCFDRSRSPARTPRSSAEGDGLDVVRIERPAALATDNARAHNVAVHALEVLGDFDAVAVIQATSPFTAPEDLAGAVELLERTGAASVVSVVRVAAAHHPLKLKVMEGDRLLPWLAEDPLTPSHELEPLWVRNGSIYVFRREVIAGGLLVPKPTCRGYEMPPERSFDIDTPRDLAFAEFLLER